MNSVLEQMLNLLSDEDKKFFESLSAKLSEVKGDVAKLSIEDQSIIQSMEGKYGEGIKQQHTLASQSLDENDLLARPFALHVRQILARDLGDKYPQEEDAIAFAFESKWLPLECQQEELAENWYRRFQEDITELNQWREDLVEVNSDKKMAIGLAWFMVIFQLKKVIPSSS